jgi:glycine/D-amino acid oxidase-like deaminating enzyme
LFIKDYLIVGQGIAGSVLAYLLIKQGQNIAIIDESPPSLFSTKLKQIASSPQSAKIIKYSNIIYPAVKPLLPASYKPKVLGGMISPVTGKRFVKTWMADQLLPFARQFYTSAENELNARFYYPLPIIRLFSNPQQANEWSVKSADESYIPYCDVNYKLDNPALHIPYGYTTFKKGAVIDGMEMLTAFYGYFKQLNLINSGTFNIKNLKIRDDAIIWEGIKARGIIFCEGWKAVKNPLFKDLPFMPAKGELLIFKSEDLKLTEIINKGIFIRPLGNNLYLCGSTYKWDDLSPNPTQQARDELEKKLHSVIKTPYTILEQLAGIRPTVKGRRPFLGRHPHNKNVLIFNGLGTKGLLLAPFFADHLCGHLLQDKALISEIDIRRFYE